MESFSITYTACNLCGQDDTKLIFTGKDKLFNKTGSFEVVQCNHCGLVYTNPRPTEETIQYFYPSDYDPYKEDNVGWRYIKVFSEQTKLFNKVKNDIKFIILKHRYNYSLDYSISYPRIRWLYQFLKRVSFFYFKRVYYRIPYWTKEGRALDFGCGRGAYLLMLRELGWSVVGFDIAKAQSKHLSDRNIPVAIGSIDSSNYENNSFDIATLWHSLEHTHQPLKVLKKIYKLLKKGSLIYVEVPNNESFARYLFQENWFPWEIPRHLYHFSPRTLKKMLLKAGFEEVKINHLCKKTIMKSFFYWLEGRNINYDFKSSKATNFVTRLIVKAFALLRGSEIIFAVARKPL